MTETSEENERRSVGSPDGSQIAYSSRGDCYVISALGGVPRKVLAGQGRPAWSPDGTEFACAVSDGHEVHMEIVSLDLNRSRRVPLERVRLPSLTEIAWSRDGCYVAYIHSAETFAQTTQLRVARVADGTVTTELDDASAKRSPGWSVDGHTL